MYGSFFGRNDESKTLGGGTQVDPPLGNNEPPMKSQLGTGPSTPLVNSQVTDTVGAGSATIWSGVINLTNTIVGAGMLGLPGAFAGTGYFGGTILVLLGSFFSAHGLILLSKAAQRAGLPSSFYSVAQAAVPQYTVLIDLAVALKCFGVATGYLITVGDCMVDALDHILLNGDPEHDDTMFINVLLSRQFWVVAAVLAVMPFSFYRTLDDLKKTSALALIFVFFLAFGIIAYAQNPVSACPDGELEDCRGEIVAFTDAPSTLSKLPIFIFAFTCHQNIFPIVNELQNRTQERLNAIVFASIGFALVIFYIVAIEGYHTFGSNVRGDILLNYPENGYVTILRICIAFMLALHYPLQLDPSRRCISSLIAVVSRWSEGRSRSLSPRGLSDVEDSAVATGQEDDGIFNDKSKTDSAINDFLSDDRIFYAITISFLFMSFVIAMIVDDLGVVLAMVGATGSTLVSYILPGLIYVKLQPVMDLTKIMAYVQLILGCLIMPVALYFVVMEKVKH
jgi:amino acid permease